METTARNKETETMTTSRVKKAGGYRSRSSEIVECRDKGRALARQVSSLLKSAGFPQAGRFSQFGGYAHPGYQISEMGNGTRSDPTAYLFWADGRFSDRTATQITAMMATVMQDGRFLATRQGSCGCMITRVSDNQTQEEIRP